MKPLLIVVAAILLIWWLINTMNTGNPLWFSPIQPIYEPSQIIVYDYGREVVLRPGDPGYSEISDALNLSLDGFRNTALSGLGLSTETLRRYREEELVLEIHYGQDIRFNTPIRMTGINQLLIPIDGTHAGSQYVFIGSDGQWRVGPMVMEDDTPLMDTMRALGYLQN